MQRNDELYHHGIEGQKWGKRNGPPYPLNKSEYTPAELKAIKNYKKSYNASKKAEKAEDKYKLTRDAALANVSNRYRKKSSK